MIILEGPDGSGKSTLAKAIEEKYKAIVLHASYDPSWDIAKYHEVLLNSAAAIEEVGCQVVLDRWALSEAIYGKVFRGKEAYDTKNLLRIAIDIHNPILIYCSNDNVVQNHQKNKEERYEMFDDMTTVSSLYDLYINSRQYGEWIKYDFTKTTIEKFLEKIDEQISRRH